MVQRMLTSGLIAAACSLAPLWVCQAQAQVSNTLQDKPILSEPKSSTSGKKNNALQCDPDPVPFTPETMGPGVIPPGATEFKITPKPNDPCTIGGTWRKIGDTWRKVSD